MNIRDRITEYRTVKASSLIPHPENWRLHPDAQRKALQGVMEKVGNVGTLLTRRMESGALQLIDGHLRKDMLGNGDVRVAVTDLTEDEARAVLATFDEIGAMAEADTEKMDALVASIKTDNAAMQGLLQHLGDKYELPSMQVEAEVAEDPGPQLDRADELLAKWKVKRGDVWEIPSKTSDGVHRVMCGDSTESTDWATNVGAVVTDPPYGIGVDTSWLSALNVKRGKPACVSDDQLANDDGDLDLSVVFSSRRWTTFGFPYIARTEAYTGLLVWDKRGDGGEGGIGIPIEVAASNAWNGYRLVRCPWAGYVRPAGEYRHPHPTQKPVAVMAEAIRLTDKGTIVDPFLGSGTTLVACEQLGRLGIGMEIEPKYVAVALQRLADMGLEPRRAE